MDWFKMYALYDFQAPMMTWEKISWAARVLTATLPTAPHPPRTITFAILRFLQKNGIKFNIVKFNLVQNLIIKSNDFFRAETQGRRGCCFMLPPRSLRLCGSNGFLTDLPLGLAPRSI